MSARSFQKGWRGVHWPPVKRGVCTKHGRQVGPVTGCCVECHLEQLEAAKQGSSAWERKQ